MKTNLAAPIDFDRVKKAVRIDARESFLDALFDSG